MQSYESDEPRHIAEGKSSQFNASKPVLSVPELSLVMDKPHHTQMQMNGTNILRAAPELKLSTANDSSIKANESYAAWREKQFSHHMDKSKGSPAYPRILSSTHNNSNSPNSHDQNYMPSVKLCNSPNCNDPACNSQSLSNNISPNKLKDVQRAKLIESIVNKYSAKDVGHNKPIDQPVHLDHHHQINNLNGRTYSGDRIHPALSQTIDACDFGYRHQMHRSHSNPNVDYHSRSLQPMHFNQDPYPHSCSCSAQHNNSMDTETVKHMLQIISSQNEQIKYQNEQMKNQNEQIKSQDEQIKNLQKQIERLIKLHEQSLKNWKHCSCQKSNGLVYQNAQMYAQNNYVKENERGHADLKESEKSKQQAILEQKVSIGVMTSFELKVQNNQSVAKDKKETQQQKNNYEKILPNVPQTSHILKNLVNDTGEMIRKQPISFNPHALDNISEASESRLSSNRQSNLCSDTRQSPEVYMTEVQKVCERGQNEVIQKGSNTRFITRTSKNQNNGWYENGKDAQTFSHEKIQSQSCRREQGEKQYEYDSAFDNIRSVPHINEESSDDQRSLPIRERRPYPVENYSTEPYDDNQTSPIDESVHQNKSDSPNNIDQDLRYENNRLSPYESQRDSEYNDQNDENYEDLGEEPLMSTYNKIKNPRRRELPDECLSLSSSEVDVAETDPPSPERSLYLEMPEYSSESGSLPPQRQSKPGWTMCDNVLYQVNQILQNSSPVNNDSDDDQSDDDRNHRRNHYKGHQIMNQVKAATLEQLAKMGLSYCDNIDQRDPNYNQKVVCEESYYVRKGIDTHLAATSASIETDTSLVKAIDLKYLNKDQLKDIHQPRANMSVSQINYLHRYHLVPNDNSEPLREAKKDNYRGEANHQNDRPAPRAHERRRRNPKRYPQTYQESSKVSYPSKILDVSALKQQPKLL